MTVNEKIIAALEHLGHPVVPGVYTGKEKVYLTFNYDQHPCQFAGNRPIYWKALIQVHLVCPLKFNSIALRRQTLQGLMAAGFTWPTVVDATDEDVQHFVYECELITKEMDLYGGA